MREWQSQSHVRWYCRYHVLWVPKYRKRAIFGEMRRGVGRIVRELCQRHGVELVEGHALSDHVHVLVLAVSGSPTPRAGAWPHRPRASGDGYSVTCTPWSRYPPPLASTADREAIRRPRPSRTGPPTGHGHDPPVHRRAVIVLVAARTQIGYLINSEWRKHPAASRAAGAGHRLSVRMRNLTGSLPSRRSSDAWLRRRSHSMSSSAKRPKRTQRPLMPSETASDMA